MLQFFAKSTLLLLIVAVLQFTVFANLHRTLPLERFEACFEHDPEVVFFGDSCNAWVDAEDVERQAMSELLDMQLVDSRVGRIDGGAFHLELYEAFVDLMIARGSVDKTLVIPINLRSFSAEWDARPSYSFATASDQIRSADNRLLNAFAPLLKTLQWQKVQSPTLSDYRATPVYDDMEVVGTVADFDNSRYESPTPERVRNKFIFHYMYALSPSHRKLEALRQIARKADAHRLRVVFYITPIDVETGSQSLGERFPKQLDRNVAVIREQLRDSSAVLLDWSQALDAKAFSWHDYPNEHLKESGRRFVATELTRTLAEKFAFRVDEAKRLAACLAPPKH